MLQSHALRGLLLILVVASCAVKAEVFVDDDIQAVVIEGNIYFAQFLCSLIIKYSIDITMILFAILV